MDISELLIEVKNTNKAVGLINKVNTALKKTSTTNAALAKTLLAGYAFTRVIAQVKKFGDAWRNVLVTFRNFKTIFGLFNSQANKGLNLLVSKFQLTDVSAKKLLGTIGSKLFDFDFSKQLLADVSSQLAVLSKEIGAFYQIDSTQVADRLAMALSGNTRSLREFGILIDQNSPKIKLLMTELQLKGYDLKTSKALAIIKLIIRQSGKFKGSFLNQTKSISNSIENLTNTLNTGIFAKIGLNLSKMFVPALLKLNQILSNKTVQDVGGLVGTIAVIGAALLSLAAVAQYVSKIVKGLVSFKIVQSSLSAIGPKLAALAAPIIAKIVAVLTTIVKGVLVAVGAIFTPIGAAILAALAAIGVLVYNKIKTGSFFDFSAFADLLKSWGDGLADFIEKVRNLVSGFGWQTDREMFSERTKDFEDKINEIRKIRDATNLQIKELTQAYDLWLKGITTPPTLIDQAYIDKLARSVKADESWPKQMRYQFQVMRDKLKLRINDLNNQILNILTLIKGLPIVRVSKRSELLKKRDELKTRLDNVLALAKLTEQYIQNLYLTFFTQDVRNRKLLVTLQQKMTKHNILTIHQARLIWSSYINQFENLLNTEVLHGFGTRHDLYKFKKNKFAAQIKDYKKHIDELEQVLNGKDKNKIPLLTLNLLKQLLKLYYTKLMQVNTEKGQLELDNLAKLKLLLEQSNQMILSYMDKISKWSPSGVLGLRADTMLGYKFMTSEYGRINSILPVIQNQQAASQSLEQQAIKIFKDTGKTINDIYGKLQDLAPKVGQFQFTVVN